MIQQLAWKTINIDAALAKNMYAMMTVQNGSIGPGFKRMPFSQRKRLNQRIGRKPFEVREFCGTQGGFRMKRF